MTTPEIKPIEPLLKQFSLPEEVKRIFYKSLFGSLLGQAVLSVGLIASYLAILAFLYSYAKAPLRGFQEDFGPIWFWFGLTGPLAAILIFTALPTTLRALRERRLRDKAIAGVPKPGYFRLQPYGEA